MNCHRRDCRVTMREVDAFPRIGGNAPVLTMALAALTALLFAAMFLAAA